MGAFFQHKWLFPTWSWASLNSATGRSNIDFLSLWKDEEKPNDQRLDDAFLTHAADEQLAGDPDAQDRDPNAGKKPLYELRLKGPIFPIAPETLSKASDDLDFPCDFDDLLENEENDWDEHVGPEAVFYCLRIVKYNGRFVGLALVCVDEERQVFERIGLLEWDRKEYGNNTVATVIIKGRRRPDWWEPSEGEVVEEKVITLI